MEEIVNRVASSSLVSLDFDEYLDQSGHAEFDLKDALFEGLILREKDFRLFIKEYDWLQFKDKNVRVHCSVDAIIPTWAFMLISTKVFEYANISVVGSEEDLEKAIISAAIDAMLSRDLGGARVVIKGCGGLKYRDYAYFELTNRLIPRVASIMYGEPCSTVPVFKKKK